MATSHATGRCIRAKNKVSTRLDQLVVKNFSNRRPPSTNGSCPLPTFSPYFSFPSSTSSSYTSCSSSPPSTLAAAFCAPIFHGSLRIHAILPGRRIRERPTRVMRLSAVATGNLSAAERHSQPALPSRFTLASSTLCARRSFPRLANFWYVQQFPATGMLAATGQKLLGISRLSAREPMYGAPRR